MSAIKGKARVLPAVTGRAERIGKRVLVLQKERGDFGLAGDVPVSVEALEEGAAAWDQGGL
ncbi:hypothetical protein GCM10022293_48060 [Azospirillum formosense]